MILIVNYQLYVFIIICFVTDISCIGNFSVSINQSMDDVSVHTYWWIVLTAFIWGGTNPFLRKGALGIERVEVDIDNFGEGRTLGVKRWLKKVLAEVRWCLLNWKLTLPFTINQSGSVLFFYWLVSVINTLKSIKV